ncbi:unnamed protein product [Merluccius merluccius]
MMAQQKLVVLWSCTLLLATLCPVVQSKRGGGIGGFFKGKGKGSQKEGSEGRGGTAGLQPTKKSLFSSKVKLAGAAAAGAAAGAVGGAAVGYGLGSWGRPRHSPAHHGYSGKNHYRVKSAAAAAPGGSLLWTLGSVMVCLSVASTRTLY